MFGVKADPAFVCKEVDGYITTKTFEEYVECSNDCDCEMYEVMCLERPLQEDPLNPTANFTLHHRSLDFA